MHGPSTFASRFRIAMDLRGETYEGLAQKAGYGTSLVWEYRRNRPRFGYKLQPIIDFAAALRVRPAWLAFGEGDME